MDVILRMAALGGLDVEEGSPAGCSQILTARPCTDEIRLCYTQHQPRQSHLLSQVPCGCVTGNHLEGQNFRALESRLRVLNCHHLCDLRSINQLLSAWFKMNLLHHTASRHLLPSLALYEKPCTYKRTLSEYRRV